MTEIIQSNTNIAISEPSVSPEGNLTRYLKEIRSIPVLEEREEYELAKLWIEKNDSRAAHRLVTSHLRLVAKIAAGYRGYGLPYEELLSEGNVGIMHAVKRFNPDKGARLSTYASWWIKAAIQEYVLKNWSMVKIGTTAAQKKLFFKLRSTKEKIGVTESGDMTADNVQKISKELDVSESEITSMNRRLIGGDLSLQTPRTSEEDSGQWQDWIEDDTVTIEQDLVENQEMGLRRKMLEQALTCLNQREIEILNARRLQDKAITLEDLSEKFNISKERVRQIENRAFEKLQIEMQKMLSLPPPSDT